MTRQRLGQHFLTDLQWCEEIARAIGVSPHSIGGVRPAPENSCWIELGSGHGEMTKALLSTGAPVTAVELDPPLVKSLRKLAESHSNLAVHAGDILQTDLAALSGGRRIRVYGNLPYYITSPILHHLFGFADVLEEIHIVIQTEVALRLAAEPGTKDYGFLTVLTQLYARPEFVFEIPRDAFSPPPKVTSALVTLRLPGQRAKLFPAESPASRLDRFLDFAKLCFSQKRKTLANNLKPLAKPDLVRGLLAELNLRADARAEQLGVSQLHTLFVRMAQSR